MRVSTFIKKLDAMKEKLQQFPPSTIIHTNGRDWDNKKFTIHVKYKEYCDITKQLEYCSCNYEYVIKNRSLFPDNIELFLRVEDKSF